MKKLFTLLTLLVAIVTGAQAAKVTWTPVEGNVTSLKTSPFYFTVGEGDTSFRIYGCRASKDQNNEWDESGIKTTDNALAKSGIAVYIPSTSKDVKSIKVTMYTSKSRKAYYTSGDALPTTNPSTTTTLTTTATEYEPWGTTGLEKGKYYSVGGQSGGSGYIVFTKIEVEFASAETAFTVSFNAGTNGTCETSFLTESEPGAGVTLPNVSASANYSFNGWYTASEGGTKAGDYNAVYYPSENITLYAQYSELAAPTIEIDNYAVSTYKGVAKTFTATVTGVPGPTVTWYQSETTSTTGGTKVGTGLTYQPDVTTEGEFYYYAVASNSEGTATSQLITLTVTDPNEYITGNSYYIETGDVKVGGAKVYGQDITMQYTGFTGGSSAAIEDNMLNGVNSNYVASVSHSSANGWGVEFTPTANGILKVGVIINKDKTFSITNVNSFSYVGKNGANPAEDIEGTINSGTYKTPDEAAGKMYVEVTINVVAGTKYKFSVASSKMGFYGFKFTPTLTLTDAANSANGEAVAAVKGKTVNATVTRSLASDKYYGVFLPFALTAAQIQAAFGEGAVVAAFTGEVKNEKTFMFGKLGTDEGMEAYKGYLVKAGSSYAGSFTVEGVTIPTQVSAVGDAAYAMVGTLDRYTYTEGSTIYYFTNAGTIKKLTSKGINGLRAFMADNSSASKIISSIASNVGFEFGGGGDGEGPSAPRAREVFGIDLEDDVVTGIEAIDNSQLTIDNDAPAYNLAGQKVGKGYKGIVIINGKKVVK